MDTKDLHELARSHNVELNLAIKTVEELFSKMSEIKFENKQEAELYMQAMKSRFETVFNFQCMVFMNEYKLPAEK